jgi:hypothetical protein
MGKLFDRESAQHAVNELRPLLFELAALIRQMRREAPAEEKLNAAAAWGRTEPSLVRHGLRVARYGELIALIGRSGAQLKDPETGLIDFPAQLRGREVLLCWRLGEEQIAWYHDEESGYRGRKKLEP